MFNSQRINNDPEPYEVDCGVVLGTFRQAEEEPSVEDFFDVTYKPRPEYDNNPNPILVQFRKDRDFTRLEILEDQFPHEHHARKVLERLVNVYTEQ